MFALILRRNYFGHSKYDAEQNINGNSFEEARHSQQASGDEAGTRTEK